MILTGTSGNDTLIGTLENDSLSGLAGNDVLNGKAGADTYLFNRGDGQDTLKDDSNDTSVDKLIFSGTGLTSTNAIVTRLGSSSDLKISFAGITDSVILKDQVYSSSANYGVESIQFSNGVTWTEAQLWNAYLTLGAATNDTLEGTATNDTIRGGLGTDYLNGKAGADTYLFNRGDGQDTLKDDSNDTSVDKLIFSGTGLTSTNAIVTRLGSSSDLKISFAGITDSVILKDQVYSSSANYGVESIQFSNGVTWTEAQLWNAYLTLGAATNDTLEGTATNDTIRGGLGTDYLNGKAGADTYLFNRGDGQDTLKDDSNDTSVDKLIFSGTGLTSTNAIVTRLGSSSDLKISFAGITDSVILKDQVYSSSANYGVESIQFSNGVTWTEAQLWNAYLTLGAATNDTLEGTATNDTIRGGLGTDYLNGKAGADTYLFNRGDGQDTLKDDSNDTSVDKLIFSGTGLTSTNAIVTRLGSSSDLKISFAGITDSVILKDQVYSSSANYGVESIQFSNGVTWTEAQLWNAYLTLGAATNDTLEGTATNDTIRGGLGTDYLNGKAGADTYLFNRGDGQDTLKDDSNDTSVDKLIFSGTGLTSTNAIVTRLGSSSDLKISFAGITDSVILKDQVYSSSANYGVESIQFSNGVTWTEAQLWNAYLTLGAATNDTLEGTATNDTIRGGLGTDYLNGKAGADTYLFNRGDGQDTLKDDSNDTSVDKLIFSGTGLTSTNAIVTRLGSSSDLKISFAGITDSVILKDQVYSSSANYGVESIQFSNGVTWTEAQLWNAYLTLGAATNDTLTGTSASDTIVGGIGTDYLNGGAGGDTYLFNRGDGQDTLDDSSNDTSIDKLIFSGTGLTSTNAIVTRIGSSYDLKISFGGTNDSVILKDQVYSSSANYGVESIQFSNGVTWTEAQLWNAIV